MSMSGRWDHLQYILCRGSPLAHPDFEPSPETLQFLRDTCKVLVIGAGGLGCELLKDLALLSFTQLHCIDMDTIDLSNLNRQFLFRTTDIGKSKAQVAADFINKRVPGCCVTPYPYDYFFPGMILCHNNSMNEEIFFILILARYCCKIQDHGPDFYQQFHIIVCGLDSIVARRWINGMALSLLRYGEDGQLDQSSIIPIIDGGTEGFKGNARVILPGITACMDCTLDLYPPQVTYPLCTIASKPRLPQHCIEYIRLLLWTKEKPFGDVSIDGDNPDHIMWIFKKSQDRAAEYGIQGVTYRLTQGVVKHIIPAVASTNAVIAAVCAMETFKLATSCSKPLQNYMVFNDTDGVYTFAFEAEKNEDCPSCSMRPITVSFSSEATLQELYDYLKEDQRFMMKLPSLTTVIDGKNKTLYMPTLEAMERATKDNLKKTLTELGLTDGHNIVVADVTTPKPLSLTVKFVDNME